MTDQANSLRNLILSKRAAVDSTGKALSSRVITVSSGKGGVGKSNFSINLAIQLSKRGKRVIIIDADFGLANIEVLMGVMPKYNFGDVISGKHTILEVLNEGPNGIKFISGGSGFSQLATITENQIGFLIESFSQLDAISDIILIDTGAGISKQVMDFIIASNEAIIITTPEPTSITDAYAIIKSIKEQKVDMPKFNIVVNRVDDRREGDEIFAKLDRVCTRFLDMKLTCLGYLPYDTYLVKAVKAQKPVSILYPNAPVVKNIETICENLLNVHVDQLMAENGLKNFMKKFINVFRT